MGLLTVCMASSQKYVAAIIHRNVFEEIVVSYTQLDRNTSDVVQNFICLVFQHAFVTACSLN